MNEKVLLKTANRNLGKFSRLIKKCQYFEVGDGCNVKYIANCKQDFLMCGLMITKLKNEKNIHEKDKLNKNAKNFYKLFYRDGLLQKVEIYIGEKLDFVYLCYYEKNFRLLKPFSNGGGFYPTYSLITVFSKDKVEEEFMIDGSQIIIEKYFYNKDNIEYEYANMVPTSSTHKTLSYSKGLLKNDATEYVETENYTWLKERIK